MCTKGQSWLPFYERKIHRLKEQGTLQLLGVFDRAFPLLAYSLGEQEIFRRQIVEDWNAQLRYREDFLCGTGHCMQFVEVVARECISVEDNLSERWEVVRESRHSLLIATNKEKAEYETMHNYLEKSTG